MLLFRSPWRGSSTDFPVHTFGFPLDIPQETFLPLTIIGRGGLQVPQRPLLAKLQ